jgi:hypothetical protein
MRYPFFMRQAGGTLGTLGTSGTGTLGTLGTRGTRDPVPSCCINLYITYNMLYISIFPKITYLLFTFSMLYVIIK